MSKYKVVRELGCNREGGRITYLATDTSLNPPQQVVIKEFRFAASGANWSAFKAYEREIEVLRELNHPHIPRYLDSFETKAGFCLVQEYKNALSLAVRRSFNPEEIKQIAVSVLEVLVYLQHRVPPVIHRDIKPENILVDKQLNAYLVDFGFARIRGEELAMSSVAAGTPGFMPPEEQFGRPLTEASDLYSLGATLICLLTGTRSVEVGKLINDDYRFDFKKLVPQVSPRFVQWLTKLVEPNLRYRYSNAAVALEALKPIQVKGGTTERETLVRTIKSRRAVSVLGWLAVFSIFAFIRTNGIFSKNEEPVNVESYSSPVASSNLDSQELPSYSNQAVPFHISSINNTFFAMVGSFEGEYRIYPEFIEVTVKKGTIYLLDSSRYKGRRNLTSVTFSLGTEMANRWNTVNPSQSLLVNRVMKPGDTYTFTSARFLIPKNSSIDLSKHWLIVKMEVATLDGKYAGNPGFTYAHSRRDIFHKPGANQSHKPDANQIRLVEQLLATKKCPGCNLQNANLSNSILVRASLSKSNLEGAKLYGANLQNASLEKANLKRSRLRSSNLKGANLQNANLEKADISNARLQGANLKGANLEGARLVTSNLEGANLEGANLLRANVAKNTKLEGANLKGAIMPDGSRHD